MNLWINYEWNGIHSNKGGRPFNSFFSFHSRSLRMSEMKKKRELTGSWPRKNRQLNWFVFWWVIGGASRRQPAKRESERAAPTPSTKANSTTLLFLAGHGKPKKSKSWLACGLMDGMVNCFLFLSSQSVGSSFFSSAAGGLSLGWLWLGARPQGN